MRLNHLVSFVGFILLIAATYCPILRPFHLFNMDVYDGNKPYGIVILLVALVGIIGTVFSNEKLVRLTAWISVGLVVLFFILAVAKVYTSFSFIPLHGLDAFLTRQIKFKWGWFPLFIGPLLALAGSFFGGKRSFSRES
jgi:predicted membrane channel-forming protein YqfA (hemolysin III family)